MHHQDAVMAGKAKLLQFRTGISSFNLDNNLSSLIKKTFMKA